MEKCEYGELKPYIDRTCMSVTINVGVIGLTVIKTRACAARLSVLEWRHYASYSLMQLICGSSSVEGSSLSSSKGELGRNKLL